MTLFNYRLGSTLAVGQILSWGAVIEKKDSMKPNTLKFVALFSSTPVLNDEVKYYNTNGIQAFGGYLQKATGGDGTLVIEVADYSVKLSQERFSEVYKNKSPEFIIEDIITNYTELTYSSSYVSGIIVGEIIFKDEWILDGITKMMELFNGGYDVDLSKIFTLFQNSTGISSKSITYGTEKLDGGWITDIQKKAEKVIVLGAIIDQRTSEPVVGTGTTFVTSYKPENVEIAGFQQTTPDIVGDYTVDIPNLTIEFNSSQTDPTISYTYKTQVRVELGTGKTVILEKKYLESKLEARKLAVEYRNRFFDGAQSSKWLKVDDEIEKYTIGDLIYVTDDKTGRTGYYNINNIKFNLPKQMVITVGETEDDLFNQQKEAIERIKQLEKTNQNSDFITKYDYLESKITVSVSSAFTKLQGITDEGDILFASETTLSTDADLISDDGVDADFALAYDEDFVPSGYIIDYLDPDRFPIVATEDDNEMTTEDGIVLVI